MKTTYYEDVDGDNFGNLASTQDACSPPNNYVSNSTDCDDSDGVVYPSAPEICDGQYNNCSDGSYNANSAPATELDGDSDNYVDCSYNVGTWVGSVSVVGGDDCDDSDGDVYPAAPETCDGRWTDCDSQSVPADETDDDTDGYVECVYNAGTWVGAVVTGGEDCDDADIDAYPGAFEIIDDTIDQDCNGSDLTGLTSDELSVNDLIITEFMADGFSDPANEWFEVYNTTAEIIDVEGLYIGDAGSTQAYTVTEHLNIEPGEYFLFVNNAAPASNGGFTPTDGAYVDYSGFQLNNGGDSIIISNDSITVTQIDYDNNPSGDDFLYSEGVSSSVSDISQLSNNDFNLWCASSSVGYTDANNGNQPYYGTPGSANDDCDADGDGDFAGLDCDDTDASLNLADADSDGETTCDGDCNDVFGSGELINTSATEICDSIDNDCDGDIDDADGDVDLGTGTTFYLDDDSDGYGDNASTQDACVQPADYVTDNTDCDDSNGAIYPFADESDSDNIDSNCDEMEADSGISDCTGSTFTSGGSDKYFVLCYAPSYINSWTWTDADNFCQSQGYDGLASILSADENTYVGDLITNATTDLSGRNPHIGLTDVDSEGVYLWSNGDVFGYDNWDGSEPSNSGSNEHCTEFYNTANTWNDLPCSTKRDFVCSAALP